MFELKRTWPENGRQAGGFNPRPKRMCERPFLITTWKVVLSVIACMSRCGLP